MKYGKLAVTKPTTEELEKRLEALELKVAFQDDTVEQLNQEITALNMQNSLLKRQIELLAQKMKETKGSAVASEAEETPPPHY